MKKEKTLKRRISAAVAAIVLTLTACGSAKTAQDSTPAPEAQQVAAKADAPTVNAPTEKADASQTDTDETVINPETMPSFPGGTAALLQYLMKNMKYPQYCREHGIKGKVIVSFIVNTDGSLTDITVVSPVDKLLDEEAVRVISNMPKWNPGTQRGKPVRVKYSVPVNFNLN